MAVISALIDCQNIFDKQKYSVSLLVYITEVLLTIGVRSGMSKTETESSACDMSEAATMLFTNQLISLLVHKRKKRLLIP